MEEILKKSKELSDLQTRLMMTGAITPYIGNVAGGLDIDFFTGLSIAVSALYLTVYTSCAILQNREHLSKKKTEVKTNVDQIQENCYLGGLK